MTDTTDFPKQTPDQAALIARVRRLMLIAGLTTALAIGAVLIAIGYRLFHSEGRVAAAPDIAAVLPKGARGASTAIAGDQLVVTLDIGGATETRTLYAKAVKPVGGLKFVNEP